MSAGPETRDEPKNETELVAVVVVVFVVVVVSVSQLNEERN